MEHCSLYELMEALEFGTNLHISVVFLSHHGNDMTRLPREKAIHSKPFCTAQKVTSEGLYACVACRNEKLRRAVEEKQPFGGNCIHGIYEYCHPVLMGEEAVAVIFAGNILPRDQQTITSEQRKYLSTFQREGSREDWERICLVLDRHICLLIREYQNRKDACDPLIENIRNYIEEGLCDEVTVLDIASAFHYNGQYLGKRFKRQTGKTLKESINEVRLKAAAELLSSTRLTVTEIAARTGFNSPSYLNRRFRHFFGKSPRQYREEFFSQRENQVW